MRSAALRATRSFILFAPMIAVVHYFSGGPMLFMASGQGNKKGDAASQINDALDMRIPLPSMEQAREGPKSPKDVAALRAALRLPPLEATIAAEETPGPQIRLTPWEQEEEELEDYWSGFGVGFLSMTWVLVYAMTTVGLIKF